MNVFSAVVTLILVMDPLGNVPLFLAVLKSVPSERRRAILIREILIAYVILLAILFLGRYELQFLQLDPDAVAIAGGTVLFLIALRMIFPTSGTTETNSLEGEPFVVPLAIPLFAGPSTLATILLLQQSFPSAVGLLLATTIAWAISGAILMASTLFYRLLKERGLIAMERLMGMLLVAVGGPDAPQRREGVSDALGNGRAAEYNPKPSWCYCLSNVIESSHLFDYRYPYEYVSSI
jgi:multiple antibiotic resistance protein